MSNLHLSLNDNKYCGEIRNGESHLEATKDFGKLRVDDYINNFKAELQRHLREYNEDFILVDDDKWSLLPDFSNTMTDEELKQV